MSKKQIDLTPELKKPMDRTLMNNDAAVLRTLVAEMNNPALTGAVVPPGEGKSSPVLAPAAPVDKHGATVPPVDPLTIGTAALTEELLHNPALTKEQERAAIRATVRQPSIEAVALLKEEESIVLRQLDFCHANGIVPVPAAGQAIRNWLINRNIKLAFKQLDELSGKNL